MQVTTPERIEEPTHEAAAMEIDRYVEMTIQFDLGRMSK